MDHYYRDITAGYQVHELNWDHPEMFHLDEWRAHLELLATGNEVEVPQYDFCVSRRTGHTRVTPSNFIVAEGQFALHPDAIPNFNSINIFVDLPVEEALARRLQRDHEERGRSHESIRAQWDTHVMPAWQSWVEPSRLRAHVSVTGSSPRTQNLKQVVEAVAGHQANLAYIG